jgi:hypothetical protein
VTETTKNSVEILEEGLRLIARNRHWTQGKFMRPLNWGRGAAFCMNGAINMASSGSPMGAGQRVEMAVVEARRALSEAIGGPGVGSALNIERWNDEPGRTHEEVVAAFRLAIENEKKRLGIDQVPDYVPEDLGEEVAHA